jgi:hypothetical protein
MEPVDVGIELRSVNAPHPTPPDLHGWEVSGAHEGIDLRHAHVEVCGDIFERQQARFDARRPASFLGLFYNGRHGFRITLDGRGFMALSLFKTVWTSVGEPA